MDKTIRIFYTFLSKAMGTSNEESQDLEEIDWEKLFSLSRKHNIIPMIYESVDNTSFFSSTMPELFNVWRNLAISSSINQMYRTKGFLKIYDKLNKEGILGLVVKGIICRELYPNHYYRSSGDEDVYIQKKDFHQVDAIFLANGLLRKKGESRDSSIDQVTTYQNLEYSYIIELHIDLFPIKSELIVPLNMLFVNAFQEHNTVMIDGIEVHTLSHDLHMLFLILHSIKHFLAIGFGIRQVCDIVMYCNTYGQEIDWNLLWSRITELKYDVFLLNLLDIGTRYLGLAPGKISYPKEYSQGDIHSIALLEDIMEAGVFGKSNLAQAKTRTMTMSALADDRNQKRVYGNGAIGLRALFPEVSLMGSNYSYCRKYPYLLPIAWIHRAFVYISQTKNPSTIIHRASKSFTIGRKRIELLKEYRIIGRDDHS